MDVPINIFYFLYKEFAEEKVKKRCECIKINVRMRRMHFQKSGKYSSSFLKCIQGWLFIIYA